LDEPLTQLATTVSALRSGPERFNGTLLRKLASDSQAHEPGPEPLDIAFVNLMPDSAFLDTEGQFLGLLSAASGRLSVPLRVRRFWIQGVPRGAEVMRRIAQSYLEIDALIGGQVDGLIVTGTEPRAAKIDEEAFWPALAELIEWSADAVSSVVLSCLASHAAAKLFDGVERSLLPQKLSGVYPTDRADAGAISEGLASSISLPHSRSNDIPTSTLAAHGYRPVLTSGESWTAMEGDRFRARLLLFQGHPEYAANSLLREHRRDVRRYLMGERSQYPPMPEGYLDEAGLQLLREFAALPTTIDRDPAGIAAFPAQAVEPHIQPSWRHAAETIYSNWLGQVMRRRAEAEDSVQILVRGVPVSAEASINA
jgi:homoserine O-succinyltransferase